MANSWTAARIERELGECADQLDELEAQTAKVTARRRRLMQTARDLRDSDHPHGVSYRTLAPWARVTSARVHAIMKDPPAPSQG